jgi:hypothetical protein
MQCLRRSKHGASERMSDHDVVAHLDGEHGPSQA